MTCPDTDNSGQSKTAERLMKLLKAMRELHERNKRNYLSSLEIREQLGITPNTSRSRQFLRDLNDALYLSLIVKQEGKCPSCGHGLPEEGLFCLPPFKTQVYVEPDYTY